MSSWLSALKVGYILESVLKSLQAINETKMKNGMKRVYLVVTQD